MRDLQIINYFYVSLNDSHCDIEAIINDQSYCY